MDTATLRLFGTLWLIAGLAMLLTSVGLALGFRQWFVFTATAPYGLAGCVMGLLLLGAALRLHGRRAS